MKAKIIAFLEAKKDGEDMHFKRSAYQRAIYVIQSLSDDEIANCSDFKVYDGIGDAINKKIFKVINGEVEVDLDKKPEINPVKHRKSFDTKRISLKEAKELFYSIDGLRNLSFPAGSIRRRKELIADIDLVVIGKADYNKVLTILNDVCVEALESGDTKTSFLYDEENKTQIDVNLVEYDSLACALLHHTGSADHNTYLRTVAKSKGWKLNQYHLYDENDKVIETPLEQDVYKMLGIPYTLPENR